VCGLILVLIQYNIWMSYTKPIGNVVEMRFMVVYNCNFTYLLTNTYIASHFNIHLDITTSKSYLFYMYRNIIYRSYIKLETVHFNIKVWNNISHPKSLLHTTTAIQQFSSLYDIKYYYNMSRVGMNWAESGELLSSRGWRL